MKEGKKAEKIRERDACMRREGEGFHQYATAPTVLKRGSTQSVTRFVTCAYLQFRRFCEVDLATVTSK